MHSSRTMARLSGLAQAALIAGTVILGASAVAGAGNLGDEVYADSFGNLIVQSPYGTKRIIVGEGYRAKELAAFTSGSNGGEPHVVYSSPPGGFYDSEGFFRDNCYRPARLLKGRSYMYGLPDGVVPEPSGHCE